MKSLFITTAFSLNIWAQGQTGWNFQQTRTAATDIVVADIINGSVAESGSGVRGIASIQVIRTLQGSDVGSTLSLEWNYRASPNEPAGNGQLPAIRALLFLKKSPSGTYEPLRVGIGGAFGGVYAEVPRTSSSLVTALTPDVPLEQKLAREVEWALDELVREHGADLAASPAQLAAGGPRAGPNRAPVELQALFEVIGGLKIENSRPVYKDLSAATDPNLKMLGLMGRIGSGETGAFEELEFALPKLTPVFNRWRWATFFRVLDFSGDLPAAHAMARMAVGETPIPGLETAFLRTIGSTHSFEFLPYLAVMLESPEVSVRQFTFQAFCALVRPQVNRSAQDLALWTRDMTAYCPTKIPMDDYEQDKKDHEFWSQWWASHSTQIGQRTTLPRVSAPARYQAPLNYIQTALPQGVRLQAMLPRANTPPGLTNPVTRELTLLIKAKKATEADLNVWNQVAEETNARLADNQKRARDLLDQARLQRSDALRESARALDQERQDILRGGVQDLRNRLSINAWNALNDLMSGDYDRAAAHAMN